jgi:hypothetical protein
MSYIPLAEDSLGGPSLRWWWYPKGTPLKGFVIPTLPKAKIPILKG